MDSSKKALRPRGVRWIFALMITMLAAVMIPAVAAAGEGHNGDYHKKNRIPDPQTRNAPLLNWNGGETRLQKCFGLRWDLVELQEQYSGAGFSGLIGLKLNGLFVVENWTGDGLGPVATNRTDRILVKGKLYNGHDATGRNGEKIKAYVCFSADFTSQKAGLAVIKGVFSGPTIEWLIEFGYVTDFELGLSINTPLDEHQWLAGWMQLTDPELVNEPADSPNPDGITKKKAPEGEIPNMAGKSGHDLRVRVKGILPLGSKKGGFGKDYAVLPDDYAALAEEFAVDKYDIWNERSPIAWDVHDDNAPPAAKTAAEHIATEHVYQHHYPECSGDVPHEPSTPGRYHGDPDRVYPAVDSVDNCTGHPRRFSTVFGRISDEFTWGPFDELKPKSTLLSDGKLDFGDAMMPPVRIDAKIAPPSKDKPLGGAGNLSKVKKTDVYSIDWNGDGDVRDEHELYAPFYETRIPATSAGPMSSGTTGVKNPNNFTGFLKYGLYQYWSFADYIRTPRSSSDCAKDYGHRYTPTGDAIREDGSRKHSIYPNLRPLPYGKQTVALYTDEHGEAWFHWNPGKGFNYDAIPGVFTDINGACDLQGKPVLGQSDIYVEAKYPYQPVFGEPRYKSGMVKKEIVNGFNKALYYEAKQPNSGVNGYHVTAWYTEIDGNGPRHMTHERVCFATSANGLINVLPEQSGYVTRVDGYKGWTCVKMKSERKHGGMQYPERIGYHDHDRGPALAEITVRSTDGQPVTVFADFVDERIKRSVVLGGKSGGTVPPAPGEKADTTAPKGAGTTTPTAAVYKAAGVAVPQVATRALKVQRAKFKKVRANGVIKRGIVFAKFISPTKKVRAKVSLFGMKNGQLSVLKSFKVTKKANTKRMIRVKVVNKKLAKKVKFVRVTPIKAVGRPVAS